MRWKSFIRASIVRPFKLDRGVSGLLLPFIGPGMFVSFSVLR